MGFFDSIWGGAKDSVAEAVEPTSSSSSGMFSGLFSDDEKVNASFITSGLMATGTLIAGLFANEVNSDNQDKILAQNKETLAMQMAEKEKDRELSRAGLAAAERARMLQARLAAIQANATMGMEANTGYSRQADVEQRQAQIEQGAISNLIGAQGALR